MARHKSPFGRLGSDKSSDDEEESTSSPSSDEVNTAEMKTVGLLKDTEAPPTPAVQQYRVRRDTSIRTHSGHLTTLRKGTIVSEETEGGAEAFADLKAHVELDPV